MEGLGPLSAPFWFTFYKEQLLIKSHLINICMIWKRYFGFIILGTWARRNPLGKNHSFQRHTFTCQIDSFPLQMQCVGRNLINSGRQMPEVEWDKHTQCCGWWRVPWCCVNRKIKIKMNHWCDVEVHHPWWQKSNQTSCCYALRHKAAYLKQV